MKTLISYAVAMVAATALISSRTQASPQAPPSNVQAWGQYDHRDYKGAVATADDIVKASGAQAAHDEAALAQAIKSHSAVTPPVGIVSDKVKAAIFANTAINDVATAYFIKGLAYVKLGNDNAAKAAFTQCETLPLGRCWDPDNPPAHFWSPAAGAADQLKTLK
jgi:hypothetical protein